MGFLCIVEESLPPGFRFHPRDDELVCDYLATKAAGGRIPAMVEVDLNKCEPWDLPESAKIGSSKWYFFTQRDRKYATGKRTNRATAAGYWKATGKDKPVVTFPGGDLAGMRKTLVFYHGRAPKGTKTQWVMHEFRIDSPLPTSSSKDWVLCRVLYKSKGPPLKPLISEACYDDTGTSSLAPPHLKDAFYSFDPQEYGQMALFPSLEIQRQQNFPAAFYQNFTDGSSESYLTESGNQSIWDQR